jgi:hypothetical protein
MVLGKVREEDPVLVRSTPLATCNPYGIALGKGLTHSSQMDITIIQINTQSSSLILGMS